MELQLKNKIDTHKKIIVFDVDSTLTISRSKIDPEMSLLFQALLERKKVAIITGGAFADIDKQVLSGLSLNKEINKNLILLPINGASLYTFDQVWQENSMNKLSQAEKTQIIEAINLVDGEDEELKNKKSAGLKIQDRGGGITYSALGHDALTEIKHVWDPDYTKRKRLQTKLVNQLPNFEVKIGGTTSIDITAKGIDKAYAIKILIDKFNLDKKDIIFLGDAVYENGNDYPVYLLGIDTIKVAGPEETKKIIRNFLEQKD